MAEVASTIIEASRRADRRMAGRETPFLFNCWYVAGFAEEFGRTLRRRTILGRPLVLYRTEAGAPVALSDRCVHRSYPLSRSRLDGDTIVCGYHGLRYDPSGRCVEAPALGAACPQGIGIPAYPLREQGPLVWIWMGDREPEPDLPMGDWIADPGWPSSQQYYHLPSSYVALHENLLDLTHLSFLHAETFGTPDFAPAPYEIALDEQRGHFKLTRSVMATRLPEVWGRPLGLMNRDAARIVTSEFLAASAHLVTGQYYAMDLPEAERPDTRIRTAHLATPETHETTHYFIHHARNYAVDDASVTALQQTHLTAAFLEDVTGLTAVEEMVTATPTEDRYEISLSSDRAGVAMRRWLLKAVEQERA